MRQGSAASAVGFSGFSGAGASSASWYTQQESTEHCTTCTSVKEYCYAEDKNLRFRPQMEDSKLISECCSMNTNESYSFWLY